jgi:8-oxo-dGTP pyrophosphatase MutT (NUDIX family)
MDHPTQRLLERTNLPESYSDRLRGAIKGLPLPRGVVHARMPDGSFAVFKDAGGKKRLATFLSKHMSPPGRDVTPLVKEKLMKKSANHMVEPSPDGGNYMAVGNLKSLKRNSEDMMCYVDPATPLPDWVESKLNVAAASIDDVADWFRNGGELNKLSSYSLFDELMKLAEDPRLEQAGVEGYNKPKRTPGHPTKSHIVVAKDGDQIKTIRFGQQGVKTNQTAGQREAFKSRHAKNIAKGKMSAAYWADKVKWSPSKTKDKDNENWVKGSSDLSYLKKLADFANETLAQKAHDQVVKEYGLTPQDGSQYWRLKTRIYKSMGGTFTGKRAKKASETYRPRVELFIHDGKGNVLANRSDKGWQFPGGGIEEGQDIFEAARREALEEAGYKIKGPKTLGNEASMVPWPEWYKEVARSKGRGQYEGQKTHAIVAQVGKKDNKLYGSEGDALTKLKFVPLKKLIRDGEKRISPEHDDIVTNTGEVIPGFAVFSRDTLKHLKNLEQELAGKKTAADFSLMSVAKDLRKTAGVYDLSVRGPNTKEAGFNPFSLLTKRMASGKALTTRREFIGDALTNAGMTAATTGQAVTGGRRPSVLGKALSIFTGADSPMKITRRDAIGDLAIRLGLYQKSRQLPVGLAGQKPGSALGQVASVAGNKMDEVMTKRDFLRNMFASGTLAAASSRGPAIQKLVDNRQITDKILSPAQMVSGVSAYGGLGTLAEGAKAMSKHPGDILGAASSLAPLGTKNAPEWFLKNPNNPVKNIVAGLA